MNERDYMKYAQLAAAGKTHTGRDGGAQPTVEEAVKKAHEVQDYSNLERRALLDRMIEQEDAAGIERLKLDLAEFIEQEAHLVKGFMANESKKQLAREVIHLRGVVKTVKASIAGIGKGAAPAFGHREAFALMTYAKISGPDDAPAQLRIWNSRDGITPFMVNIGEARYQHELGLMLMPFFDVPVSHSPTHKWVTRLDWEVLEAWQRTLERAVESGRMDQAKADSMKDRLDVAESWNYRIGLVNLATGFYTDQEVLRVGKAVEPAPTAETAASHLIGD